MTIRTGIRAECPDYRAKKMLNRLSGHLSGHRVRVRIEFLPFLLPKWQEASLDTAIKGHTRHLSGHFGPIDIERGFYA